MLQYGLARQCAKLLPVDYYLATFTLPYELRGLAKAHPKTVYRLLIECAVQTLKTFAANKKDFNAELGLCAVLHTHTRRLDFHPHVHIVIPGAGVHRARREWRKISGAYLFNGRALARNTQAQVFRGLLLKSLAHAGLPRISTPRKWIVHCEQVGRGQEVLRYLSRYLYRGVISPHNILHDDGKSVTFQYRDAQTKAWRTRTVLGEDFIQLLLQHVLPKGFRRSRDYGFLHGNAKALLRIVQWVLRVQVPVPLKRRSPHRLRCQQCRGPLRVVGFRHAQPRAG